MRILLISGLQDEALALRRVTEAPVGTALELDNQFGVFRNGRGQADGGTDIIVIRFDVAEELIALGQAVRDLEGKRLRLAVAARLQGESKGMAVQIVAARRSPGDTVFTGTDLADKIREGLFQAQGGGPLVAAEALQAAATQLCLAQGAEAEQQQAGEE